MLPSRSSFHVDCDFLMAHAATLPRSVMWGIWETPRTGRNVHVSEWLIAQYCGTYPLASVHVRSTSPQAHSLVGRNGGRERTRSEPDGKGPETTTHPHGKSKYRLNSSICARRSSLLSLGAFLSAPARRAVLPLHCNFATGTPGRPPRPQTQSHLGTSHTHPVTHSPSYTCAAVRAWIQYLHPSHLMSAIWQPTTSCRTDASYCGLLLSLHLGHALLLPSASGAAPHSTLVDGWLDSCPWA